MSIRLNKLLANSGLTSRRKVSELLLKGGVSVNGKVVKEPGTRVDPDKDKILVDGKKLEKPEFIYIALNKPKGVISTTSDEHNRKTVVSLVGLKEKLYPVGRLDKDSTGLILLTNDGELTNKLTHPKFEVEKTYQLTIVGEVPEKKLDILRSGVRLKEGVTSPAKVKVLHQQGNRYLIELKIHEGKNHEIKKMCAVLKLNLVALKRVAIGNLELGDLPEGKYRRFKSNELKLPDF